MHDLAILDLDEARRGGDAGRQRFADAVGRAMHEVGYFILDNPGLPPGLVERGYALAQRLFALDEDRKRALAAPSSRGMIGYIVGDPNESYGKGEAPTEMWHMGREFPEEEPLPRSYFRNRWPALPEFREVCGELYAALGRCAEDILSAYTLFLGGDPAIGVELLRRSWSILRMMRYPPWSADKPEGVFRASPHVDASLLSLYTGGSADGLEFRTADGAWHPIASRRPDVLVGAGELFEILSLGLVRPTTHRVTYPSGDPRERYALPFFILPRPDLPLSFLAEAARAHGGQRTPPDLTVGELVARRTGWGDEASTQPREHRPDPSLRR